MHDMKTKPPELIVDKTALLLKTLKQLSRYCTRKSVAVLNHLSHLLTDRRFLLGVSFTLVAEVVLFYRKGILRFLLLPKFWRRTTTTTSTSTTEATTPTTTFTAAGDPHKAKQADCPWVNFLVHFLMYDMKEEGKLNLVLTELIDDEVRNFFEKPRGKFLLDWNIVKDWKVEHEVGWSAPMFVGISLGKLDLRDDVIESLQIRTGMLYEGGFRVVMTSQLMLGYDMVTTVEVRKVKGTLRVEFNRSPSPNWNIAFVEFPEIEIAASVEMNGVLWPVSAALVVQAIKLLIWKKHTLPNFKKRTKPFFWKETYHQPSRIDPQVPISRMNWQAKQAQKTTTIREDNYSGSRMYKTWQWIRHPFGGGGSSKHDDSSQSKSTIPSSTKMDVPSAAGFTSSSGSKSAISPIKTDSSNLKNAKSNPKSNTCDYDVFSLKSEVSSVSTDYDSNKGHAAFGKSAKNEFSKKDPLLPGKAAPSQSTNSSDDPLAKIAASLQ